MGAIIDAIFLALHGLVSGSLTLVGYVLLPSYRKEKQEEWNKRPVKKYLDLGISGACLGVLFSLGIWISALAIKSLMAADPPPPQKIKTPKDEGGFEFRIETEGGKTIEGRFRLKKDAPEDHMKREGR